MDSKEDFLYDYKPSVKEIIESKENNAEKPKIATKPLTRTTKPVTSKQSFLSKPITKPTTATTTAKREGKEDFYKDPVIVTNKPTTTTTTAKPSTVTKPTTAAAKRISEGKEDILEVENVNNKVDKSDNSKDVKNERKSNSNENSVKRISEGEEDSNQNNDNKNEIAAGDTSIPQTANNGLNPNNGEYLKEEKPDNEREVDENNEQKSSLKESQPENLCTIDEIEDEESLADIIPSTNEVETKNKENDDNNEEKTSPKKKQNINQEAQQAKQEEQKQQSDDQKQDENKNNENSNVIDNLISPTEEDNVTEEKPHPNINIPNQVNEIDDLLVESSESISVSQTHKPLQNRRINQLKHESHSRSDDFKKGKKHNSYNSESPLNQYPAGLPDDTSYEHTKYPTHLQNGFVKPSIRITESMEVVPSLNFDNQQNEPLSPYNPVKCDYNESLKKLRKITPTRMYNQLDDMMSPLKIFAGYTTPEYYDHDILIEKQKIKETQPLKYAIDFFGQYIKCEKIEKLSDEGDEYVLVNGNQAIKTIDIITVERKPIEYSAKDKILYTTIGGIIWSEGIIMKILPSNNNLQIQSLETGKLLILTPNEIRLYEDHILYQECDEVDCLYTNGQWYSGIIKSCHHGKNNISTNNKYSVIYDDGDTNEYVDFVNIRQHFIKGDIVIYCNSNTYSSNLGSTLNNIRVKWYIGKIVERTMNNKYTIYNKEYNMTLENISYNDIRYYRDYDFKVNDEVTVLYSNLVWYKGRVIRAKSNRLYDIYLDYGDIVFNEHPFNMRKIYDPRVFNVGDRIVYGVQYLTGIVNRVNERNTFNVYCDNGLYIENVTTMDILYYQHYDRELKFKIGDIVRTGLSNNGDLFTGVIQNINYADRTYDILTGIFFQDQYHEDGIAYNCIERNIQYETEVEDDEFEEPGEINDSLSTASTPANKERPDLLEQSLKRFSVSYLSVRSSIFSPS